MSTLAFAYGSALVVIGVAGYVFSGAASVTALIPAFIGAPMLLLGYIARNPRFTKHAMHAAVVIALLALLGTSSSIAKTIAWIGGEPPERQFATVAQFVTALLSIAFLSLAVRSFVRARRDGSAAA